MTINSLSNHITSTISTSKLFNSISSFLVKEESSIHKLKTLISDLKYNWHILENDSKSLSNSSNANIQIYLSAEIRKIILELKKVIFIDKNIKKLAKEVLLKYDNIPINKNQEIQLINIEDNKIFLTENRILLFIDHNEYSISKAISSLKQIMNLKNSDTLQEQVLDKINETKTNLRQVFIQSQAIIKLSELLEDKLGNSNE